MILLLNVAASMMNAFLTLSNDINWYLEKVNEILGMVFQYINLLKQQPPKEWVFKEMKVI